MILYMAGGVSGNLKPLWKEACRKIKEGQTFTNATEDAMRIFLAGGGVKTLDTSFPSRRCKKKREMQIYLAGQNGMHRILKERRTQCSYTSPGYGPGGMGGGYDKTVTEYRPYILESFFYADEDTERLMPHFGDFLLDSGAFTFMQGKGGSPNWDEYVERYADFISRNKVQKYFELDIDSVVGYERVKKIRAKLERLTGRQSIPVWHLSRGMDEYRGMCKDYSYVAIGGIVSGEITKDKYKAFPVLIAEAHNQEARIHGLGFTNLALLPHYHFDSVDSTAWTTGNRFGFLYYFDGKTMVKRDAPKGHKIGASREAALNNFVEWLKYQKYAEKHL